MSAAVDQMFRSSQQARAGGVVRRSARQVDRQRILQEIIQRARAQGFHVVETGGQIVLLCHEGELIIHC